MIWDYRSIYVSVWPIFGIVSKGLYISSNVLHLLVMAVVSFFPQPKQRYKIPRVHSTGTLNRPITGVVVCVFRSISSLISETVRNRPTVILIRLIINSTADSSRTLDWGPVERHKIYNSISISKLGLIDGWQNATREHTRNINRVELMS